jgi:hypothetical protein
MKKSNNMYKCVYKKENMYIKRKCVYIKKTSPPTHVCSKGGDLQLMCHSINKK